MAVDQTTAFQQIADSDPELQRLLALGRAQGSSSGDVDTQRIGANRSSGEHTFYKPGTVSDQIQKRQMALGITGDYNLDPRTGRVSRANVIQRNLEKISLAAAGGVAGGIGLSALAGPGGATAAGAPGVTPSAVASGIPGVTSTSGPLASGVVAGVAQNAPVASTPLWSRIGSQATQPSRWDDLSRVLGNAGQSMTDNRGAQNQENYLHDALMLNAKAREAELEQTNREDARKDLRRSDAANSWTPTGRPSGVPTISFTKGPGPQYKEGMQGLATQALDRLSKPPVGMGTMDANGQVSPYATTPSKRPSIWEQLATYGAPAARLFDWFT